MYLILGTEPGRALPCLSPIAQESVCKEGRRSDSFPTFLTLQTSTSLSAHYHIPSRALDLLYNRTIHSMHQTPQIRHFSKTPKTFTSHKLLLSSTNPPTLPHSLIGKHGLRLPWSRWKRAQSRTSHARP